jgi:phage recombination protein Bet
MSSEMVVASAAQTIAWTAEQQELIRNTFANGASAGEFAALCETAKVWGLDPFRRQLFFVKRWDSQKRCDVWSVQVSVDGLRAIAERTGLYAGQDEPHFEYDEKGSVKSCRVRVYRKDWERPMVGVAHWSEYVQTTKEGRPTQFWATKPHIMLAKCAEAIALRKAFPQQMAGAYAPEEMGDEPPVQAKIKPGRGAARAETRDDERSDVELPPTLLRVQDSIDQLGGSDLTADQAGAIWVDHYAAIVEGGLRDRAGELLELALADGQKTRFRKVMSEHESKVAATKREAHERALLEDLVAKVRATKSNDELGTLVAPWTKEQRASLVGYIWQQKVSFCSTVAEIARLLADAKQHIKTEKLLDFVRAAAARRQREIEGPGDDGGPDGGERAPKSSQAADDDPEREAIQAEGAGSLETQALAAAVDLLRRTNGPKHAINHYIAHRGELAPSLRAEYRAALLSWLPARYPAVIASRAVAEAELARAEESSVLRAA